MPIAELNVGRAAHDLDDPRMAGFMDNLVRINALAERSKGFVWRYKDESGNATSTKIGGDPRAILNLSVWETAADLEAYVFGTVHARFYARKAEWFEALSQAHFVMWPVEAGEIPTVEDALARLDEFRRTGPTDRCFGWEALPNARLWIEKRCA